MISNFALRTRCAPRAARPEVGMLRRHRTPKAPRSLKIEYSFLRVLIASAHGFTERFDARTSLKVMLAGCGPGARR
jgi:hypothetical protein